MNDFTFTCPVPIDETEVVSMAHGAGGRAMHKLITDLFAKTFPALQSESDAASLTIPGGKIAITTDSHVITPLFFPGGDIGSLSVYGTVNDLTTAGARPRAMTAAFIIAEGFPMKDLRKIVASMQLAAERANVSIVTGDTKIVGRNACDGIFINTTGIGERVLLPTPHPSQIRTGDAIIVSGNIGTHGTAILSAREELSFTASITSDSAPLWDITEALWHSGIPIRCMRDATRGGLAAVLVEIAKVRNVHIAIDEERIPVDPQVSAVCEMLGLDPMNIANEGKMVYFVPSDRAEEAIAILRQFTVAKDAAVIGQVKKEHPRYLVTLRTAFGQDRVVDLPHGEKLPRIC